MPGPNDKDISKDISKDVSNAKLLEIIENQNKIISSLEEKVDKLADPKNRTKKIINENSLKVKDGERTAKFVLLEIDLTKDNEFMYFEDDRERLANKEKVLKNLLITGVKRTYNVFHDRNSFLIGDFICLDENRKEINVTLPFKAVSEYKKYVLGRLVTTYADDADFSEGVEKKYIKNDEGQIIDEREIDLTINKVKRSYDVKIISDGLFKDLEMKKVDESNINLL